MSDEVLINVTPRETRVAVVESGVLQEFFLERANRHGLVGAIIKGRILRVLPGMQAAFVDIGRERSAFLHVSDIVVNPLAAQTATVAQPVIELDINQLLHEGQDVLVQVFKDQLGSKGARLTTQLSIASRYLVYMPSLGRIGISQRISDEAERERLKNILEQAAPNKGYGFIVRTNGEGVAENDIIADVHFLLKLWDAVVVRAQTAPIRGVIYEELPLVMRIIRDINAAKISRMRIDSKEIYEKISEFALQFVPELAQRIEYYDADHPIYDLYGIEDEIQRSLEPTVYLKSGGSIVIEQTEAMTTIDVNTGGFVGRRNLDETIFKTNLEATQVIGRQLRLRNLGGIIIIDFIDMTDVAHQQEVLRALEKALEKDPVRSTFSQFSPLGLVEVTRKRTHDSLEHVLCEPCHFCQGRGYVKSVETICYEILRDILQQSRVYESKGFLVLAARAVVDMLLDDESASIAELETLIGKPIRVQVEALYLQDNYDVVLL